MVRVVLTSGLAPFTGREAEFEIDAGDVMEAAGLPADLLQLFVETDRIAL